MTWHVMSARPYRRLRGRRKLQPPPPLAGQITPVIDHQFTTTTASSIVYTTSTSTSISTTGTGTIRARALLPTISREETPLTRVQQLA
jgi:hypothetical protein